METAAADKPAQSTALAERKSSSLSLIEKFALKFSIEPDKLMGILRATCFKVKDETVSNEQMAALLVVADQYNLNPFTKQIFAFPDKKNGIVPVVSVDGWAQIINDHPQCDGFEFRESPEKVVLEGAKSCPEWMEVVFYRKDRSRPTVVREYLDEVYRELGTYPDGNRHKPGPWQTHTKRFFRHKVLIQGARIALGFGGIYDEDEAGRIIDMGSADVVGSEKAGAATTGAAGTATGATNSRSASSRIKTHLGTGGDAGTAGSAADASTASGAGSVEDATVVSTTSGQRSPTGPVDGDGVVGEGTVVLDSVESTGPAGGPPGQTAGAEPDASATGTDQAPPAETAKADEETPETRAAAKEAKSAKAAETTSKAGEKPAAGKSARGSGKTETAGEKPVGTRAVADKLLERIAASKESDVLAIVADEANLYTWSSGEEREIQGAYVKRLGELEAG